MFELFESLNTPVVEAQPKKRRNPGKYIPEGVMKALEAGQQPGYTYDQYARLPNT